MDRTARQRGPERLAIAGLALNVALTGVKLAAGLFGRSSALVADAVESMTDIVGSAVIWGALRYGRLPPDEEHPYGHGKAEALAALAVALLVLLAGVGVGVDAALTLVSGATTPSFFTLPVLVGVIVVKEGMHRAARRAAAAARSSAGMSDAWHHRADAITSLATLAGLSVAVLGGPAWAWADPAAAGLASLAIIYNAWRIAAPPLEELMDTKQEEVAERAARSAMNVEGVEDVEQCVARKSGRAYFIDMHIEVDPAMSVEASHRITGRIKEQAALDTPEIASVLIHVEPAERSDPAAQG
jgi:cation diffusion facilitator family transporter